MKHATINKNTTKNTKTWKKYQKKIFFFKRYINVQNKQTQKKAKKHTKKIKKS